MTMWPPPARIMSGRNSRVTMAAPTRLTSNEALDLFRARLLERVVHGVAGVVDQYLRRAELLAVGRGHRANLVEDRDIARVGPDVGRQLFHLGFCRLELCSIVRDDADDGAALQEIDRELLADSARAARNEYSAGPAQSGAAPALPRGLSPSVTLPKATRLEGTPARRIARISTVALAETTSGTRAQSGCSGWTPPPSGDIGYRAAAAGTGAAAGSAPAAGRCDARPETSGWG